MTKLKTFFAVLMAACLMIVFLTGFSVSAKAETVEPPAEQTEEAAPSEESITDKFIGYLKDKYGEDYEYYYNLIIEKWGSVEAYLASLTDELPDEYRDGWTEFIAWLHEYWVVWAPTLAVVVVIIIALVGKAALKKAVSAVKSWFGAMVDEKVNTKLNEKMAPVARELNSQSSALGAMMRAQKALLGNADKFSENVQDLDKSEKELTGNE